MRPRANRPVVPPVRQGVSPSRLVVTAGPWSTVAGFLAARLRPGIDWPARLAAGDVVDDEGRTLGPEATCHPGQVLWYWRHLSDEPRVEVDLTVLHVDADLVVVDKPHGLASIPGGRHLHETALIRLRCLLGNDDLTALHRLDRDTAGVMLFSANPDSRSAYHALVRAQGLQKVYEAVAPWRADLAGPVTLRHRLHEARGERHLPVQVVPGEPNAVVRVSLQRRLGSVDGVELALYRLEPTTGRRHQLRAQMNALGCPILGDRVYPRFWPESMDRAVPEGLPPLQLLARELRCIDPMSGQERRWVSARRLALDAGPGPV